MSLSLYLATAESTMFSCLASALSFCACAGMEKRDRKTHAANAIYKNFFIASFIRKHTKITLNFGNLHIFGKNVLGMQH
jgi:hypothetical protein